MNHTDYMKRLLNKLDDAGHSVCQDCGQRSQVSHAIVDHEAGTVRTVCNDCFNAKYRQELYGRTV